MLIQNQRFAILLIQGDQVPPHALLCLIFNLTKRRWDIGELGERLGVLWWRGEGLAGIDSLTLPGFRRRCRGLFVTLCWRSEGFFGNGRGLL